MTRSTRACTEPKAQQRVCAAAAGVGNAVAASGAGEELATAACRGICAPSGAAAHAGNGTAPVPEACAAADAICGNPDGSCAVAASTCSAYVYMVECADGTLYTGWTTHVAQRVAAHNAGRGAKYTRSRRPVFLRYSELCVDKPAALRRERALKQLSREQKLQLLCKG